MKYIITEDKFDSVISFFLHKKLNSHGGLIRSEYIDPNFIMWFHDDNLIFELNKRWGRVLANASLWDSLISTFGLSDEEVSNLLKNWLITNESLPDGIFVVRNQTAEIKFIGEM